MNNYDLFAGNTTDSNTIIVVSGLPRSGTSMMMKMLESGNIPLLTDSIRRPDIDNPGGYYEFERVKDLEHDNSWLHKARGKAVKIVSPLLQHLRMGRDFRYKIIFMLRNMDEILASQQEMGSRLNHHADCIKNNILKNNYTAHLEEIRHWMESKENIDFIYTNYADVVSSPLSTAEDLHDFLDIGLNTHAMAEVIDNSLYRKRMDEPASPAFHNTSGDETEREVIMDQLRQLGYL